MATNKDVSKKVFDIAKPGKTAASASSRPLIIGHKPMLKDPMVNDASAGEFGKVIDSPMGKAGVKIDKPPDEDIPSGSPPFSDEKVSLQEDDAGPPSVSKITIEPSVNSEVEDHEKVAVNVGSKKAKEQQSDESEMMKKVEAGADISEESETEEPEPEAGGKEATDLKDSPDESSDEASDSIGEDYISTAAEDSESGAKTDSVAVATTTCAD